MEVFIEISKNSKLKYEHDEENNRIVLDRVLHNTNSFPYNYGYLPDTLSPDGDPIDIIVLGDYELLPGSWVKCKVIGGIETTDEKGRDDKILVVLDDKLDRRSKYINSLNDINKVELDNIVYFLSHYKDNEKDKHVVIGDIYDRQKALEIIKRFSV